MPSAANCYVELSPGNQFGIGTDVEAGVRSQRGPPHARTPPPGSFSPVKTCTSSMIPSDCSYPLAPPSRLHLYLSVDAFGAFLMAEPWRRAQTGVHWPSRRLGGGSGADLLGSALRRPVHVTWQRFRPICHTHTQRSAAAPCDTRRPLLSALLSSAAIT